MKKIKRVVLGEGIFWAGKFFQDIKGEYHEIEFQTKLMGKVGRLVFEITEPKRRRNAK